MIPARVTVIGSGVSGIEAARLCVEDGSRVLLSDATASSIVEERVCNAGLFDQITFEGDAHTDAIYNCDLVVVSPGVPKTAPVFAECEKRGIKIIGEVELGFQQSNAKFVAITGSAGKSTTVSLIDAVLKSAKRETVLCGNIGTPVSAVAQKLSSDGIAVVEVSSFQLETIETFAPEVAVILNLAPNHLDRHTSIEEYYGAKFEIAKNMSDGTIILNGEQEELVRFGIDQRERNRVLFFGKAVDGFDSFVEENGLLTLLKTDGSTVEYGSLDNLQLTGDHNRLNAVVAGAVCSQLGVKSDEFSRGLLEFNGLAHRMEKIITHENITYINDSKATTPESMAAALTSFEDQSVLLIAGGKDKGGDFNAIIDLVSSKCKKVLLIGDASETIYEAWKSSVNMMNAETLNNALTIAKDCAGSGDTVILSPGCASFDQFKSFVDRGDQFKQMVKELCND